MDRRSQGRTAGWSTPALALILAAALGSPGCGGGASGELPHTKAGAFLMIEGAANDMVSTVMSPTYKPRSRDMGTDSDRMGLALATFAKETEGTAVAADVQNLKAKFEALEKLTASRAPVEKQREAAKALKDAVDAVKAKL
ncbi:MAG: hypothetical protein U0835_03860 [Isosphaeraceae bacterium]